MSDSIIDTSKMSEGQRAALELAESSRDTRELSGFAASVFDGAPDFATIFPFPVQSPEDKEEGDVFLKKLRTFLDEERFRIPYSKVSRKWERWASRSHRNTVGLAFRRRTTPAPP
jgi:hypothetical protein